MPWTFNRKLGISIARAWDPNSSNSNKNYNSKYLSNGSRIPFSNVMYELTPRDTTSNVFTPTITASTMTNTCGVSTYSLTDINLY